LPYATTADLPPAVRRLPPHAQDIFLVAFLRRICIPPAREETAFRVARAAVKREYEKVGNRRLPKDGWA
jgi:cation transport regulator